jgi:spermidine synthase
LPFALVLSGFSALAVEVLWQRLLTPILGGSTIAVTAVLVAYMGGLALGAGVAGRYGDRMSPRQALRAYIRLELAVCAAVSLTTVVLAALPVGVAGVLAALPEGAARFLGRFVLASALLLLPTTAMGATLPLAVRASVGSSMDRLLGGTALLYTANTAGAVAGALAGPLILLPAIGLLRATLVAGAGGIFAALTARAARVATDDGAYQTRATSETADLPRVVPWVAITSFATGAAALGLEVIWTRALGTLAGSTVYAFGMVLGLVLAGLTLGAGAVSLLSARVRNPLATCALLALFGAMLAIVLLPLLDRIPARYAALTAEGNFTFMAALTTLARVGAAVILPPTVCFGAALPLAIRAVRSQAWSSARAVGKIYVANTLGSLLGAAATGLVLLPTIGQAHAARLLAVLPAAAAVILLLIASWQARPQPQPTWWRVLPAGLGILAALVLACAPVPSSVAAAAGAHSLRKDMRLNVVYFGEGPEASVLVEAIGSMRTFFVAGRPEASSAWYDMRSQYLLGHLPALLAGGAQQSLVIGLGSGMTAGALAYHGAVTIAELNRAVPNAARQFSDLNHDVLSRARLIIEDGRVVITGRGAQFDVVTTDPIHPYIAGSAALYTTQHLRLSKDRLKPNGAVSIWIPLHQMGLPELKAIVGSFVDVFPDTAELYLSRNNVVMVGGGRGHRRTSAERVAMFRAGWTPKVAADMRRARIGSPEELDAQVVAGPEALARFVAGARRNLDDDPWIEYSLPLLVYKDTRLQNLEALLALRDPAAAAAPLGRAFEAAQRSYIGGNTRLALEQLRATLTGGKSPSLEHALRLREISVQRAWEHQRYNDQNQARTLALEESVHPDATLETLVSAQEVLRKVGERAAVDAVNDRMKRQWPDRPEGYLWTGDALFFREQYAEAIPELERGIAADHLRGFAINALALLGRAYAMTGRMEEGRRFARQSLALDDNQPILKQLVGD